MELITRVEMRRMPERLRLASSHLEEPARAPADLPKQDHLLGGVLCPSIGGRGCRGEGRLPMYGGRYTEFVEGEPWGSGDFVVVAEPRPPKAPLAPLDEEFI